MREFTLIEFTCQEAINNYNYPVAIETGSLISDVSESHGLYSTPAIKVVREVEIEFIDVAGFALSTYTTPPAVIVNGRRA